MGYRWAHLSIGPSTRAARTNLLSFTGWHLKEWRPQVAGWETFHAQSPLADYRRPISSRETTSIETFELAVDLGTQDDLIEQGIRALQAQCRQVQRYWTEARNQNPIYLEAHASCEANPRYAIIQEAHLAELENPYGPAFTGRYGAPYLSSVTLIVERGPWLDQPPGTGTCLALAAYDEQCHPAYLEFDGSTAEVACGSPAKLDDLPDNAVAGKGPITVEAWVRLNSWGEGNAGRIAVKGAQAVDGWIFRVDSASGLYGRIECAGQAAISSSGTDEFTLDGEWHHVVMVYSEVGTYTPAAMTIYLAIDGAWVTSYAGQQASIGNYVTDAARNFLIGNNIAGTRHFDGDIGWARVSNLVRYAPGGSDFTPPPRCKLPAVDIYTMWLGIHEGTGSTAYDLSATPSNGTITAATWNCDCEYLHGTVSPYCGPAYLEFDGIYSWAYAVSPAKLDDLPDNAVAGKGPITAEAWIRANSYGENNRGYIVSKGSQAVDGWRLRVGSGDGLNGRVECAGQAAASSSGLDEFTADGEWHHVLMTYDETGASTPAARTVYLAIDGVWVTSYPTQQASIGNYVTDAANLFMIGEDAGAYTSAFDGDIGWVRISDSVRYPVGTGFTPDPRCALPPVDANAMLAVIYEGQGRILHDLSPGPIDGSRSVYARWACDCVTDAVAVEPTCNEGEVYVGNKRNEAQLTHAFFQDTTAGTWSANLMFAAYPHNLLPWVPAAGDALYLGIDTTTLDSGPFCSLVFDLLTAQTDLTTVAWEYWNGAWAALTVQDNTNADGETGAGDPFDTVGIRSVHWIHPTDWATASLVAAVGAGAPAITGYWVRARVTVIGAAPSAPVQQTQPPYTITWPWFEVDGDEIGGDMPALAKTVLRNQGDSRTGSTPRLATDDVYLGLRSLSRGADFTAYLNIADVQNPSWVTVAATGAFAAFQSTRFSPTGRIVACTNPGAAWATAATLTIDAAYAAQYEGEFHAFLRTWQTTAGSLRFRLAASLGGIGAYVFGDAISCPATGNPYTLDLGAFHLPPARDLLETETYTLTLEVQVYGDGAADCELYDLALLPVDEWAGHFSFYGEGPVAEAMLARRGNPDDNTQLIIDSLNAPKATIRALIQQVADGEIVSYWTRSQTGIAVYMEQSDQRLWTVQAESSVSSLSYALANTAQAWKAQRYDSMRGKT